MTEFLYSPLLCVMSDNTEYRKISSDYVSVKQHDGVDILHIDPEGLSVLAKEAMIDVSHLLRSSHLGQLKAILDDDEASNNDKFVALEMLKNAVISADKVLPMCQDTGTALVNATKGERVLTGGGDEKALSRGIYDTYQSHNLRFSQLAPLSMFEEVNTNNNLPAQIDIAAGDGDEYHFTFIQKGGGSANKTFLHQKTKAVLNPEALREFLQ